MYQHEYIIKKGADEAIYYKQCVALEKYIPGLQKLEELHDVDDSRIQKYQYKGKKIRVLNDCYINAVYVESEIPLEPFFEKK